MSALPNGLTPLAARVAARRVRRTAQRVADRIEQDLGVRTSVRGGHIHVQAPSGRRLSDARLRWPAAWLRETGE